MPCYDVAVALDPFSIAVYCAFLYCIIPLVIGKLKLGARDDGPKLAADALIYLASNGLF